METILNSIGTVLPKGETISVDLSPYKTQFPILVTITSSLYGAISGSCDQDVSELFFPSGDYEIPAGADGKTFTAKLVNRCSSITATLQFTVDGNKLLVCYDAASRGQSFIQCNLTGNISVSKVYQYIPSYTLTYPRCPEGYTYSVVRTSSHVEPGASTLVNAPTASGSITLYEGDSLEITASADTFGYNPPEYGLNTKNVTTLSDIKNNVQVIVESGGYTSFPIEYDLCDGTDVTIKKLLYGPHESINCDGGCYCYCKDGTQVDDGQSCPAVYQFYFKDYITINSTIYITVDVTADRVLGTVTVGNQTIGGRLSKITANENTIVNGKMIIKTTLQPPQWRTVNSSTYTFSGSSSSITKTVSGIKAGRKTRITVSQGSYSAMFYHNGNYPPVWCDGGCYCYCDDGTIVADGELCGYWGREYKYIDEGLHESNEAGNTIQLRLKNNAVLATATVSVSGNTLTFNGAMSGNSPNKNMTVTKVEQYY